MGIDRYKFLKSENNTGCRIMPPINVKNRETDIFRVYNSINTRLDRISYEVYEDDSYGWLILLANPDYAMEFDIPKNTVLRIPYPLREVITEVEGKILRKTKIS
jgi:hypothetical protein